MLSVGHSDLLLSLISFVIVCFQRLFSDVAWWIVTIIVRHVRRLSEFVKLAQKFVDLRNKNGGHKISKFGANFGQLRKYWSRMSPEWNKIPSRGKWRCNVAIFPAHGRIICELWSTSGEHRTGVSVDLTHSRCPWRFINRGD